jgi:hypothetical protein
MTTATAARERPLLFSGPMVRAILAGSKTQTRRVAKVPRDGLLYDLSRAWPDRGFPLDENNNVLPMDRWRGGSDPAPESAYRSHYLHVPFAHPNDGWEADPARDTVQRVYCPYGEVGDVLWVKETFARRLDVDPAVEPEKARHYALYRADGTSLDEPHWHSYPNRWTPPIFMPRWASRITLEIAEDRVQRLQEISARDCVAEGIAPIGPEHHPKVLRDDFRSLWDSINKASGHGWDVNDYVWAITFRRLAP